MIFSSRLTPRAIKLGSAALFVVALIGCLFVVFWGREILGARREIDLGWISLQPSGIPQASASRSLPPAICAEKARLIARKEIITFLLILPALVILVLQPDDGQTALLLALWATMLFFDGASYAWMGGLAGGGSRSRHRGLLPGETFPRPHPAILDAGGLPDRPFAQGLRAWRLGRCRAGRG